MKKLKRLMFIMAILMVSLTFTSCHGVKPSGDEESVLIYQPWFFGHGGVDNDAVEPGLTWCAWSTRSETFTMTPVQYTEEFDDIITKDNNPVDFNAFIQIEILKGKSPILYEFFGINWYLNAVKEQFRTMVRNQSSNQLMFTLTTNRTIADSIEAVILMNMRDYISKIPRNDGTFGLPVRINSVTIGKVTPPEAVLIETNLTAAEKQRSKTQDARTVAETSRKAAEIAKADADNAYRLKFGMTVDQYLALRQLEIEAEKVVLVKDKEDVTIIFNTGGGKAVSTVPLR